jgi:hypothetical protein
MGFGKLVLGVLLVGLGAVMLAGHLGYLPTGTGSWLVHYWPVLLVAIGLALLANAIQNPFLGWIAALIVIATLAFGAWWAYRHGSQARPAYATSLNLDRPRVESLTLRARTLCGAFSLEDRGGARWLTLDVRGVGGEEGARHRFIATKGGALLDWPARGSRLHDAPLGGELHVRAPERLPIRLESWSLLSDVRVDLSRLRPDRCYFDAIASLVRLDTRGPARPRRIHVKGFLTRAEVLLPASCAVRLEIDSPWTIRSLPEDFVERARGRTKTKIWTSDGPGAPILILIDGPLHYLKIRREATPAV